MLARRVLEIAIGLLLIAIIGITLWQVAGRYFFGSSLSWALEATQLLHVWMIFLAAATAPHMRITILVDVLPRFLVQGTEILAFLVSLSMLYFVADGSIELIDLTSTDRFATLPLSQSLLFWGMVIGIALWAIRIVVTFPAALRSARPDPDGSQET